MIARLHPTKIFFLLGHVIERRIWRTAKASSAY